MALLTGGEQSIYVRKYTDLFEHVLQQQGSVLANTITIESGVMGERTYFNRIGSVDDIVEHTTRFDPVTLGTHTFERRFITPKILVKYEGLDKFDLIRYSSSPESDIVKSMTLAMGRHKDKHILAALGGTANREVDGSSSNVTFDSNNTIAVNTNTYAETTLTGDTALHEGKILQAMRKLQQAQVDVGREQVFVVGSAKQLLNLRSRLNTLGKSRQDFMGTTPMRIPGLDASLTGLYGLTFIHLEMLADADQVDANLDEYVYVFAKSAVKMGIFSPFEVRVNERVDLVKNPIQLMVSETIGCVRMDEAKVVRIACDPT